MPGHEPLLEAGPHHADAGARRLGTGPGTVPWWRGALQAARVHVVATSLFVGLVLLNLVDLVTTRLVLDRGGEEGNPVMAPIIDNAGGALAVKALCLTLIGMLIARSRRSRKMLLVLAAVDAWYLAVIFWNVRVLHALA